MSAELAEQGLIDAIIESPDDDAPRLVFADWLQHRDDPRGELIAIQLAHARGEQTVRSLIREAELVRQYGKTWLGPLAQLGSGGFERGMLDFFELGPAKATRSSWNEFARNPLWRTVSELRLGRCKVAEYLTLASSPQMSSLRIVDIDDEESAERFGGRAQPFEHLEIRPEQPLASLWRRTAFAAVKSVGLYDLYEGRLEPHLSTLESQLPSPLRRLSLRVTDVGSTIGLRKFAAVAGCATEHFCVQFAREWRLSFDHRTMTLHSLGRRALPPQRLQSFVAMSKQVVISSPQISAEYREAFTASFPNIAVEFHVIPKRRVALEMAKLARA